MDLPIYIFIGLLGLIIGSFLNVVVLEFILKFRGRSKCASCNHTLETLDLVPFLVFILKGRCRYCGSRISLQYPLVEIFTAIVYVGIYYHVLSITGGEITSTVLYFIYFATTVSFAYSSCCL